MDSPARASASNSPSGRYGDLSAVGRAGGESLKVEFVASEREFVSSPTEGIGLSDSTG